MRVIPFLGWISETHKCWIRMASCGSACFWPWLLTRVSLTAQLYCILHVHLQEPSGFQLFYQKSMACMAFSPTTSASPPKKTNKNQPSTIISTIPVLLRVAGQGKIRNASFKKRVAQLPRFARKWPALKTTFLRQRPTNAGVWRWASTSGLHPPRSYENLVDSYLYNW